MTVFTRLNENVAEEIINKINSNDAIVDIFAQSELSKIGTKLFKDLSIIKSDLSGILMVNFSVENVVQRENVIKVPLFSGADDKDDVLRRLGALLDTQMSASEKPVDMREICTRINAQLKHTKTETAN